MQVLRSEKEQVIGLERFRTNPSTIFSLSFSVVSTVLVPLNVYCKKGSTFL